MVMQCGRTWRRVCSENSDLACCSDAVCREAHATLCRSKPWGPFHADVPQGDLTLEHKIDRMATVRVPRCPLAGRKVHHELYHLGLQASIRDAEPRPGDNPASPWIAGIETVWPRTAIAGSRPSGLRWSEPAASLSCGCSARSIRYSFNVPSRSSCKRFRAWAAHGWWPSAPRACGRRRARPDNRDRAHRVRAGVHGARSTPRRRSRHGGRSCTTAAHCVLAQTDRC